MQEPTGWTLAQYNSLLAAMAEGVKTVQYADKMVTYRSLDEMKAIAQQMAVSLGLSGNTDATTRGRTVGSYCGGK